MNALTDSHAKMIADIYQSKLNSMYELLMVTIKGCHAFKDVLLQSGNDKPIEATDSEYRVRGLSGND